MILKHHIFVIVSMILFTVSQGFSNETMLHYVIDAEIDPSSSQLKVEAEISIDQKLFVSNQLEFLLNRNMLITKYSGTVSNEYVFNKSGEAPYRYAQDGASLKVRLKDHEKLEKYEVHLEYEGALNGDKWGTNVITAEWLEIGLYTAWFPLLPNERFTFDLTIHLPEGYNCVGNGEVGMEDKAYKIVNSTQASDMVVIASPDLKIDATRSNQNTVFVCYKNMKDNFRSILIKDINSVLNTYNSWFTNSGENYLYFVVSERERGGGYSRPKIVSLSNVNEYKRTPGRYKYLAHELAHFYWNNAPTINWEDWLNESFAEYTALLCVAENLSKEASSKIVKTLRQKVEEISPIWGIDRNSEESYLALYVGGALILDNLFKEIGAKRFFEFLRMVQVEKINSTKDLLQLIKTNLTEKIANSIETQLKSGDYNSSY